MSFVDTAYSVEIKEAEDRPLAELDSAMYSDAKKERSVKWFAVLASHDARWLSSLESFAWRATAQFTNKSIGSC